MIVNRPNRADKANLKIIWNYGQFTVFRQIANLGKMLPCIFIITINILNYFVKKKISCFYNGLKVVLHDSFEWQISGPECRNLGLKLEERRDCSWRTLCLQDMSTLSVGDGHRHTRLLSLTFCREGFSDPSGHEPCFKNEAHRFKSH